jgi:hypothetical protein
MSWRHLFSPIPLAALCAVCAVSPLALVLSPSPPAEAPPLAEPGNSSAQAAASHQSSPPVTVVGHMDPLRDWGDWLGSIFGFNPPPPPKIERRERPPPPPRKAAPAPATYRTMCVRTCDGFYWPISYSVPHSRTKRDAQQCEKSCPGKARLFVYRNPGEEVDDMIDLKGDRYRDHPNAFLYRTEYIADCTCRGQPWDEEAVARHRSYGEAAKAKMSAAPPPR